MATLPGIPISENQCIGDSLGAINNAFKSLSGSVESISSSLGGFVLKNDNTIVIDLSAAVDRKFIPIPDTSTVNGNANLVWVYQDQSFQVRIQEGSVIVHPGDIDTTGALRGQLLTFDGNTCSFKDSLNVVQTERTGSFTLAITDLNSFIPINLTSPGTLTIPLNVTVGFPIGSQFIIQQMGASPGGVITIVGAAGVTLQALSNQTSTSGQYAVVTIVKKAVNTWTLAGNLA